LTRHAKEFFRLYSVFCEHVINGKFTPRYNIKLTRKKTNMILKNSLLICLVAVSTRAFDVPQAQVLQKTTLETILPRERYVATNRFAVKKDKLAKFEQRWATRKSRLAELEGFKYFHLMRRVSLEENDSKESERDEFGNYVSFTVWNEKKNFDDWRKGDAFKEAHGGTSIGAFLSTMINSIMVMNGPPRPAFYDAILVQSKPPTFIPQLEDGWRKIESDGLNTLPKECFVACNQFFVPEENMSAFEQRWAERESKLAECDGFQSFFMLRRDGLGKGETQEPTYMSTTIWKDRAAFEGWRSGTVFKQGHSADKSNTKKTPLWSKPPEAVFYEGTLVITTPEGA